MDLEPTNEQLERAARAQVDERVEVLYRVFASYPVPVPLALCEFCHGAERIERMARTAIRELDTDDARALLWESWDHWPDASTLKHFLPRLLQELAREGGLGDLFPGHVFEVLGHQGFASWGREEREGVSAFFDALERWFDRHQAVEPWRDTRDALEPEWSEARRTAGV